MERKTEKKFEEIDNNLTRELTVMFYQQRLKFIDEHFDAYKNIYTPLKAELDKVEQALVLAQKQNDTSSLVSNASKSIQLISSLTTAFDDYYKTVKLGKPSSLNWYNEKIQIFNNVVGLYSRGFNSILHSSKEFIAFLGDANRAIKSIYIETTSLTQNLRDQIYPDALKILTEQMKGLQSDSTKQSDTSHSHTLFKK